VQNARQSRNYIENLLEKKFLDSILREEKLKA
jgi:hypothetical protein